MATFFREEHRQAKVASTALMSPMTKTFVQEIHRFAEQEGVEIVSFAKGQNKDEITIGVRDFSCQILLCVSNCYDL